MALKPEQLEFRKQGVGSSEVAAVAGLSPWKGPHDVWADKLGLTERSPSTESQDWGQDIEASILRWISRKTGRAIVHNKERTFQSKDNKLVIATPDGLVSPCSEGGIFDADAVAEAKHVGNPQLAKHWADPDEMPDGVAPYVLPQCIWEMEATGIKTECLVGAEFGGPPRIYRVPFDQELSDNLQEVVEEFWGYVTRREPPPVDDRNASRAQRWLKEFYQDQKREELPEVQAEDEKKYREVVDNYLAAKALSKKAEQDLKVAQAFLLERIGHDAGIQGPGWQATYKQDKKGRVDWKKLAHHLKERHHVPDPQWENLVSTHENRAPRKMRVKAEGYEDEAK